METITAIDGLNDFKRILANNPGQVIIKFGAEWCKPCKQIEGQVLAWFKKMPNTVQTVLVDVDESFEIYAYMKSRKMIRGIPMILMYLKGNMEYTYDDSVSGSNANEIDMFFQRCLNKKVVSSANMPFALRIPAPPPPPAIPPTGEPASVPPMNNAVDISGSDPVDISGAVTNSQN